MGKRPYPGLPEPTLPKDAVCPTCGSPNIEENDPREGEHTCRDCGDWFLTEDLTPKAPEQAGAADLAAAKAILHAACVDLTYGCELTGPQIEELAAIVKNMLSENSANCESEVKGSK